MNRERSVYLNLIMNFLNFIHKRCKNSQHYETVRVEKSPLFLIVSNIPELAFLVFGMTTDKPL